MLLEWLLLKFSNNEVSICEINPRGKSSGLIYTQPMMLASQVAKAVASIYICGGRTECDV